MYTESGITVGEPIYVENIGMCDVYLAVQAAQPPVDHDAYNIVQRDGPPLRNSKNDLGAWAFCNGSSAKVAVRNAL